MQCSRKLSLHLVESDVERQKENIALRFILQPLDMGEKLICLKFFELLRLLLPFECFFLSRRSTQILCFIMAWMNLCVLPYCQIDLFFAHKNRVLFPTCAKHINEISLYALPNILHVQLIFDCAKKPLECKNTHTKMRKVLKIHVIQ